MWGERYFMSGERSEKILQTICKGLVMPLQHKREEGLHG